MVLMILFLFFFEFVYLSVFFYFYFTELELGTECVVSMEGQQTILQNATNLEKMDR